MLNSMILRSFEFRMVIPVLCESYAAQFTESLAARSDNTIAMANLDGTGGVNLGNFGGMLSSPHGIAVDPAGGKEKIQKGKDILVWSTIGLVVIFMSYAIVKFVLEDLIAGGG